MKEILVLLLVISAAPLGAQEKPSKEIRRHFQDSAGQPCVEYVDGSESCRGMESSASDQKGFAESRTKPAGRRRVADKQFWLAVGFTVATMVYDAEATVAVIRHGGQETNPLFGKHPSRKRLYLQGGAITAGVLYGTYWLKKHPDGEHDPTWLIAPAFMGAFHLYSGSANLNELHGIKLRQRQAAQALCPANGAGCR